MKRRKRPIGAIVAIAALAVLAFVVGFGRSLLRHIGGNGVSINEWTALVQNPRGQFPGKNRINILLAGMDYSYDWNTKNMKLRGMPYTKNSRADSIMVLSLDLDSGKVSALSVPRDTHIIGPDGRPGKINGTFSRGGAPLLRQAVTNLLGVAPDYYIAVKPNAVRDMVNVLGGVTVEAKDSMEYVDSAAHLHITLPAGVQTLNGDQAVGFARYREPDKYERLPNGSGIPTGERDSEGNPTFVMRKTITHSKEEGDPNRMARQQQLIRAMATRAKSPDDWFKLPNIIDTAYGEVDTDLQKPQILALMAIFRNMQPDQIESASLVGKGTTHGTYFFMPDEQKKEAMVDWLLKGDETAAYRVTVVSVENGTGVPGAAGRVADKLRAEGFDAKSDNKAVLASTSAAPDAANGTGNAPAAPAQAALPVTRIEYGKASVAPRAQKIAQLLGVSSAQVIKSAPVSALPSPSPTLDVANAARPRRKKIAPPQPADVTVILGQDLAAAYGPQSAAL